MDLVEAQNEILRLQEENKKIALLESEAAKTSERIKELQEHNQKLFLKLTHEPTEEKTTENEEIDLIEFAHKLKF